ncbi:hypothetical protein [Thioalkalivibrio sp. ARh3]|uniref:hypothetical protein n=1 Tax=Thioalkalivibrio sp. ARh3 TaxID=1158148 RepID=UPI00037B4A18|nr:hypothetical protein [Thioalkalivibrio sp. ARh3]
MSRQRILALPEFNVAVFAFLLNYPWEFLQVPFFDDMPTMPHWEAVVFCTRATLGDVLIALAAFWGVAALTRNRSWILQPTLRTVLLFVAIGVVITIGLEWHATAIDDRWQYADTMPTLPILGTGLLPLIQWVILPLLLIWFVRRQVRGQLALNDA